MNACWASKYTLGPHDCFDSCPCDQPCNLSPVNDLGLCEKHAEEVVSTKGTA